MHTTFDCALWDRVVVYMIVVLQETDEENDFVTLVRDRLLDECMSLFYDKILS